MMSYWKFNNKCKQRFFEFANLKKVEILIKYHIYLISMFLINPIIKRFLIKILLKQRLTKSPCLNNCGAYIKKDNAFSFCGNECFGDYYGF